MNEPLFKKSMEFMKDYCKNSNNPILLKYKKEYLKFLISFLKTPAQKE